MSWTAGLRYYSSCEGALIVNCHPLFTSQGSKYRTAIPCSYPCTSLLHAPQVYLLHPPLFPLYQKVRLVNLRFHVWNTADIACAGAIFVYLSIPDLSMPVVVVIERGKEGLDEWILSAWIWVMRCFPIGGLLERNSNAQIEPDRRWYLEMCAWYGHTIVE